MPTKLTNEIITAAIEGFESQKIRIDQQVSELKTMLSGGPAEAAATPGLTIRKRRRFSAAARKRMKEAQQRRWAKIRGESEPAPSATTEPTKPRRKLSKAGRVAIVAALKKRWAAKKTATAKPNPATKKKTAATKTAVKKAPVKAAKKAAAVKRAATKKPVAKKTTPAAAQAEPQTAAQ